MTPTTPHVLARDRTPPMFRPANQANLEPSQAANFSATQNMLPGMGSVNSGNDPSNHGLGPDDAEFTRIMQREEQRKATAKARANSAESAVLRQIQEVKSTLDRAAAQGRQMPPRAARRLNMLQAKLQWIRRSRRAEAEQSKGSSQMPFHRGARIMPSVYSPPTPDPLQYEPIGVSHESDRGKILAMQSSIQPVTRYGADARQRSRFYRRRGGGFNGLGNLAEQPLVVGGLIIGGLWLMHKSKGR